jgi:hypothetical protein
MGRNTPSRMLSEVLDVAAADPSALDSFINQHQAAMTAQLAAEAHDHYVRSMEGRDLDAAAAGAVVASRVYLEAGDRYNGLRNYLNYTEVLYVAAESADAYRKPYEMAREAVKVAEIIAAPDLQFWAATLAADCALFAAEVTQAEDADQIEAWLLISMEASIAALHGAAGQAGLQFQRLVDLVAALAERAQATAWSANRQDDAGAALQRLAAEANAHVPADFEYPGDPAKTTAIARALANLSTAHGS